MAMQNGSFRLESSSVRAAFFSLSTLIGSQFPVRLYEAERAFSAAGIHCTKIRSRLDLPVHHMFTKNMHIQLSISTV